jgi:dienelactone hydrolase
MKRILWTAVVALVPSLAHAKVVTKTVTYKDAGTELKGFFAWDDAKSGKRPGILVVHEWWGLDEYAKMRAKKLAELGYVAFALDMYGEGKVTEHPKTAGQWAGMIRSNQKAWQQRGLAGLKVLKGHELVDSSKLAAIGYCFGGATVMQMAYGGAELAAVVSFHGSLPPAPEGVASIMPRVLVAHGRDDKFIPAERIVAFQDGLDRAKAKWEMSIYSGTRHGFTNPGAGAYGMENLAYNETADKHSWAAMMKLFGEVF